jgi:hypothetical protein
MLNLERALNQDRLLRALTGLNRKALDALLPSFAPAYAASRFAAKPQRQRAVGGGRKARLESSTAKLEGYQTFESMAATRLEPPLYSNGEILVVKAETLTEQSF